MKILLILLLLCSPVWGAAKDFRVSDGDSHVLDITSSGELRISFTNEGVTKTAGADDRRISDSTGDVLDINSDGSLTLKFE